MKASCDSFLVNTTIIIFVVVVTTVKSFSLQLPIHGRSHIRSGCVLYGTTTASSTANTFHGGDSESNDATTIRPKLLIVGGGIGGLATAFDARHILGTSVDVTVLSERDHFSFTPSNPWIATRYRQPSDISLPLTTLLPRHGIHFIHGEAIHLDPRTKKVKIKGQTREIDYDYLVIATGPRLAWEEIKGLSGMGHAHSVCTTPHALKAATALDELMDNPRPVVVGATQGASCFGPAYEFLLLLRHEIRKRGGDKLLQQIPMTFITSEPYIGHLGLNGAGESQRIMTKLLKNQNITSYTNARIQEVSSHSILFHQLDENGKVVKKQSVEIGYTMLIPPFRGHSVWKSVQDLTDEHGMILVNEFQQSGVYPDIFAVGICVSIENGEKTVVPVGVPKTGYLIESMGTAAIRNIRTLINWKEDHNRDDSLPALHSTAMLNGVCITDFGNDGAIFVTIPQIPPRRHDWTLTGKIATLAKIAFEKYFLHKIETGDTDPYYEKYMLKLIGVERVKED